VFAPLDIGWDGVNINFTRMNFERDELVEMFESLPTIASAHTLNITNNPGTLDLTAEDKAIATGKGWSLVV
jgi:hypothetical protein